MGNGVQILYVEDDPNMIKLFERYVSRGNLTFSCVGTLEELKAVLDSGTRAEVYIIDGNFPRSKGGGLERHLGPEARTLILGLDPDATTALYSDDPDLKEIAAGQGWTFFTKGTNFQGMVKELMGDDWDGR